MSALVLHVLPVDLFRGAQTYARELRTRLDEPDTRHRTLTIFRSDGGALHPDLSLDVESGTARRLGLDPRAVARLRRELARLKPDLVVAHGGEPLKYAVLAGAGRDRIVYYKIGGDDARLAGAHRALHRWLLRRARAVAAVSEGAAAEVRRLGVSPGAVRVIPNGRDSSVYTHGRGGDERRGEPSLVWVGHFNASKRPERFIALVQALRADGVAVGGAMAGDGPRRAQLGAAARDAGVELLGNIDDVPRLLGRSDVFVFTGAPPEGMPGVLIEAGMAGLPVVTTEVPGAREIVEDGLTGVIVPLDDFDALVHATRALAVDAAERDRLGDAARRRCEDTFGLDASVARWRELLRELLGDSCASST